MRLSRIFLPAAMSASVFLASCGQKHEPESATLIPSEELVSDADFKDAVKCNLLTQGTAFYLREMPDSLSKYRDFFGTMTSEINVETYKLLVKKFDTHTQLSQKTKSAVMNKASREIGTVIQTPFQSVTLLHKHCAKFEPQDIQVIAPEVLDEWRKEDGFTSVIPQQSWRPRRPSRDISF